MSKRKWWTSAAVTATVLFCVQVGVAGAAPDPALRCLGKKLDATGGLLDELLRVEARAAAAGEAASPARISRAKDRFSARLLRAQSKGGCTSSGEGSALEAEIDRVVGEVAAILDPPTESARSCSSLALRAVGRRGRGLLGAHGRQLRTSRSLLSDRVERAESLFARDLDRARARGDCATADQERRLDDLVDTGIDFVLAALDVVQPVTATLISAAQPAETPGSPGVDASAYPRLVTQYGGVNVDLNRAIVTTYAYPPTVDQPDAVLVLIPGFEGGAGGFHVMAENLVTKARERGFRLEVWAFDRRSNLLEDLAGLQVAEAALDAEIALDWLFGDELGLPLHPALAGLGRRGVLHDAHADTAFVANWTNLVISQDVDAAVEAARGRARNGNVFLGGHSAGTGFTARYAATDFDLSGAGPPQPGYVKLRGLVLLEGGGGSVPASPPSADTLDRIIAKADGGLFAAVRDDAPRCVDGATPCTIATEAVDCAGLVPPVCTLPTSSYAIVPGLLNPTLLASAEITSIQAVTDPDAGQMLLQVDQGAPGNNVLAVVPELAGLGLILPPSTAFGATGSFVDDDGFPSSLAAFVRTSVGAPGPVVGGLLTWQEISEGPLPAAVLPDNGPKPTTLAGAFSPWGQEKETLRLSRMNEGFFRAGTNFTDWYYPSSGLSTTRASGVCGAGICSAGAVGDACSTDSDCNQSLGLDSSALSVGRGRRDIENLTQAASIDIPVIAFGGSNGLTPSGASFAGFASSIAPCAAASCTGAPRIVDPSLPNPAFPTFGDEAGGFEVYISEGLAHVDVIAAEDDSNSQIYGPLLDFLERNAP